MLKRGVGCGVLKDVCEIPASVSGNRGVVANLWGIRTASFHAGGSTGLVFGKDCLGWRRKVLPGENDSNCLYKFRVDSDSRKLAP